MKKPRKYTMNTHNQRMEWFIRTLIERRHSLDLSQLDIDHALGVTAGMTAKWEGRFRNPTLFNLHCWSEVLGLTWILAPLPTELTDEDLRNRSWPQRRRRRS